MNRVREEAARWFARLRHAPADHPDRDRFEAWLTASPAHGAAYAGFVDLWEDFDSPARARALAGAVRRRQLARRKLLKRGALGLLLGAAGGTALWRAFAWIDGRPLSQIALAAPAGRILHQALPDGSRLVLNARSSASVAYFRSRREVTLAAGEAIFEVARDTERPFVVDSGHARITVLGTRFAVSSLEDRTRVSVDRGRVAVRGTLGELHLGAGGAAEVRPGSPPRRVSSAYVDPFSWAQGSLVFDDAPLAEIAASLSRYRKLPVRAVAAGPHVTAVVQIADIESFIASLPAIAPVRIEATDEETRILPR